MNNQHGGIMPSPPPPQHVNTVLDDQFARETFHPALVKHSGRIYRLAELLACLSVVQLAEVEAALPRTGQAAWDEVVRRWPGLAEEIVAGCMTLTD